MQPAYILMLFVAVITAACAKKVEAYQPAGQQYAREEIAGATFGDMYDYLITQRKGTESRINDDLVFVKLMKTMHNTTNPKCKFAPQQFNIAFMKVMQRPEVINGKETWKEKWAFDVCNNRYYKQMTFTTGPEKPLVYDIRSTQG